MQISAIIESGMVRLNARVPIKDDVRKQPLWREASPITALNVLEIRYILQTEVL